MSVSRTTCPSCGAGLKSAAGFNPGQAVRCPKCATPFTVPDPEAEAEDDEPAPKKKGPPARAARARDDDDDRRRRSRDDDDDDDDDDDRPRKKKKKKGGYQEYKSSPIRFAILGVLLVVMGVLAFLLYQKKMREKEDAEGPAPAEGGNRQVAPPIRPGGARPGPAGVDPPAGVTLAAKWTPYEGEGFRVQFPGQSNENKLFAQVFQGMEIKGGFQGLQGPDEAFSVVHFAPNPKWSAEQRALTLKNVSNMILPGTVTDRRKVMLAGKEWDELSMTGTLPIERTTRRILDTGDRIIILHATYLKGRENADRFLSSFEFKE